MRETSRAIDKKLSVNNRQTMRKYEISCTIIIQNLAQLKTMYKDSYESVTGNCDSFLFLGGQEQTTLEYVSKKLGKETIRTRNASRNFGGRGGGNSLSYNTTGRELMTPDEISRMETSDCILFIRGELPFFGKKYDYPKHPNYPMTGDANDDFLFDVTKAFNTMAKPARRNSPYADEKHRIKIMSERAETRHSEKLARMERERRRALRTHSAKGEELFKEKTLEQTVIKNVAEEARERGTEVVVVDEALEVVEGYAPTLEQAFDQFEEPDAYDMARMAEEEEEPDYFGTEEEEIAEAMARLNS